MCISNEETRSFLRTPKSYRGRTPKSYGDPFDVELLRQHQTDHTPTHVGGSVCFIVPVSVSRTSSYYVRTVTV